MEDDYKKMFHEAHEEVKRWRKWFLNKHNVIDVRTCEYFLYIPFESFVKNSPEENLINSFNASVDSIK